MSSISTISVSSAPPLRWGVIGCGVIANEMAAALALEGRSIQGVANRTHDKAVQFAQKYGIPRVYDTYEQMYADPDIDAIYITTPHNTHITFIRDAVRAKKHVLAEKAITLNTAELDEGMSLARDNGVVLMDACTILHMPLYKELRRRIECGDFGKPHLLSVNFGSLREYDASTRFYSPSLAGGAMLDIGVYALTFMRTFMSSNPHEVASFENPAFTGVDEESAIILRNAEQELAAITLSLHARQPKRGMLATDQGFLEIDEYPRADEATFTWWLEGRKETIQAGERRLALNYAIADLEAAAAGDASVENIATWSHDVMELMTRLRYDWGFYYPEEQ